MFLLLPPRELDYSQRFSYRRVVGSPSGRRSRQIPHTSTLCLARTRYGYRSSSPPSPPPIVGCTMLCPADRRLRILPAPASECPPRARRSDCQRRSIPSLAVLL